MKGLPGDQTAAQAMAGLERMARDDDQRIFGLPHLSFWQALGLLALCRILFGGLRLGRGRHRSRYRNRIRERMSERWARMTPEERERFRQGVRGRCDFGPPSPDGPGTPLR